MMVSYPSANGSGVTTSPRIASHGHSEPSHTDLVTVEKIFSDAYAPNSNTVGEKITISHFACRNCSHLSTLDFTNTAQPFIWALGPPHRKMDSDSLDAPLRRHAYYGQFTMDMTVATTQLDFPEGGTYGRVPAPNQGNENIDDAGEGVFVTGGASQVYGNRKDNDFGPALHAIMMCLAFILVFPLGALLLRFLKSVLWHSLIQVLGVVFMAVGLGAAIYTSGQFNRVRCLIIDRLNRTDLLTPVPQLHLRPPDPGPPDLRRTASPTRPRAPQPHHLPPHENSHSFWQGTPIPRTLSHAPGYHQRWRGSQFRRRRLPLHPIRHRGPHIWHRLRFRPSYPLASMGRPPR
jgi:hypothetical protein